MFNFRNLRGNCTKITTKYVKKVKKSIITKKKKTKKAKTCEKRKKKHFLLKWKKRNRLYTVIFSYGSSCRGVYFAEISFYIFHKSSEFNRVTFSQITKNLSIPLNHITSSNYLQIYLAYRILNLKTFSISLFILYYTQYYTICTHTYTTAFFFFYLAAGIKPF